MRYSAKTKEGLKTDIHRVAFWRPFLITYLITLAMVIAVALIQYNIDAGQELLFYHFRCSNYIVFSLAKIVDALVPTTLTFSLPILVTNWRQNADDMIDAITVTLIVILAFMGIVFTTVTQIVIFWIVLHVLALLILGVLYCSHFEMSGKIKIVRKKAEQFDGIMF